MSLVLPRVEWPSVDREMWRAVFSQSGPLDDGGGLAHTRETTQHSLESRYARWLKWLSVTDPPALDQQPCERLTMDRLKDWLIDLSHTRPMTRLAFVEGVLRVLRAFEPDRDWAQQKRLRGKLKRHAGSGDRTRKAGRIVSSGKLLELGLTHATSHADAASTEHQRMVRRRDGAMIALLSVMPMRRRSFASLRLGTSIHIGSHSIEITLAGGATKTGCAWEATVPTVVEPVLRQYVLEVRPWLLSRGGIHHAGLWVDRKGEVMAEAYISNRIAELTKAAIGKRISAHLFRDAAATSLTRISPEAAKLIRPVLAHRGFGTAERHYIHATTIEAGRDFAKVLVKLKDQAL